VIRPEKSRCVWRAACSDRGKGEDFILIGERKSLLGEGGGHNHTHGKKWKDNPRLQSFLQPQKHSGVVLKKGKRVPQSKGYPHSIKGDDQK